MLRPKQPLPLNDDVVLRSLRLEEAVAEAVVNRPNVTWQPRIAVAVLVEGNLVHENEPTALICVDIETNGTRQRLQPLPLPLVVGR